MLTFSCILSQFIIPRILLLQSSELKVKAPFFSFVLFLLSLLCNSYLITRSVFIFPTTPFPSCSVSSSPYFIALCHSVSGKVQWSQVAALKSSSAAPPSISRTHSFSESAPSLTHVRAQQHPPCPEPPPHTHEEPPRVSTGPDDLVCVGSVPDCTSVRQLFFAWLFSLVILFKCVYVYVGNRVTLSLLTCAKLVIRRLACVCHISPNTDVHSIHQ